MKLSNREKQNIKTWVKIFKTITETYECPSECEGACCQQCDITFSEDEFFKIFRQKPELQETLKSNILITPSEVQGRKINIYEFTTHPCPLLINNKCSVYSIKPNICNMYPFKANENTTPGYITIDACPTGVQLTIDFLIFKAILNTESNTNTYFIPDDEIKHLKQMYKDSLTYNVTQKVLNIDIPTASLNLFSKYLSKTDKETLDANRQIILNKIKEAK